MSDRYSLYPPHGYSPCWNCGPIELRAQSSLSLCGPAKKGLVTQQSHRAHWWRSWAFSGSYSSVPSTVPGFQHQMSASLTWWRQGSHFFGPWVPLIEGIWTISWGFASFHQDSKVQPHPWDLFDFLLAISYSKFNFYSDFELVFHAHRIKYERNKGKQWKVSFTILSPGTETPPQSQHCHQLPASPSRERLHVNNHVYMTEFFLLRQICEIFFCITVQKNQKTLAELLVKREAWW